MSARIPTRYGLSIPGDIKAELSENSIATDCFVKQRFSKSLQEFLVDYSISTGVSTMIMTDFPFLRDWKEEKFLPPSVPEKPVDNPKEVPVVIKPEEVVKEPEVTVTPPPSREKSTTAVEAPSPSPEPAAAPAPTNEVITPKTVKFKEVNVRMDPNKLGTYLPTEVSQITQVTDATGKVTTTKELVKVYTPEETAAEVERANKVKRVIVNPGLSKYVTATGSPIPFGDDLK